MTHAQRLRTLFSAGLLTGLLTQALPAAWAQTAAPAGDVPAAKVAPKTALRPASTVAKGSITKTVTAKSPVAEPVATVHPALTAADLGSAPTRMQRCQVEISGLEGRPRTLALRECLINRAEGERLIARDCARQYRSLPTGQAAADRNAFQKQCVAGALSVAHKELPKRKPAAPKITADADADGNSSVLPVSAPAAR